MYPQAPLLRTKLHRPPVTTDLVHRERLHERLSQGLEIPLTLVSAPAGYGKSMLVSSWVESIEQPCAWLSLDETDSDITEFLTYVIAAIRTVEPTACPETEELLTAPVLPSVHVLADCLTNELHDIEPTLVLVLDDYQRIAASSPVQELLGRVLEADAAGSGHAAPVRATGGDGDGQGEESEGPDHGVGPPARAARS